MPQAEGTIQGPPKNYLSGWNPGGIPGAPAGGVPPAAIAGPEAPAPTGGWGVGSAGAGMQGTPVDQYGGGQGMPTPQAPPGGGAGFPAGMMGEGGQPLPTMPADAPMPSDADAAAVLAGLPAGGPPAGWQNQAPDVSQTGQNQGQIPPGLLQMLMGQR